ncbi:Transcriptional regulatory protein DegU [Planctomycetes bacterium MalM25]|nr:Transcriptional regulatory protein DegU [Planctomycetes bacterium MalM25]
MSTTVLLADDHPAIYAGLHAWFAGSSIEIIGEAEDGERAAQLALELRPQVVLMEVLLPRVDGLQCLSKLREAGFRSPVLCYTAHGNPTYAARASALGAAGFLSKTAGRQELIDAIKTVAEGGSCWPGRLLRRLTGSVNMPSGESGPATPLTSRESEVLKQLAFGLSNKEIAAALGISYETVKEHVQHILRKLNVADRTQAAVWAVRQGLA